MNPIAYTKTGTVADGYDQVTYLLVALFTISLLLAIILRMTVGMKIARLRAEFDAKQMKP